MKWGAERWVKLYTKDTATWRRWRWEGQCVFMQLLRKVDYDGRVDLDGMEPWEVVSVLSDGMPEDVCRRGLDALVRTKTLVVTDAHIELQNFREAQDAKATGAERQRRHRERKKSQEVTEHELDKADVTNGDAALRGVTQRHPELRAVTGGNHKIEEKEERERSSSSSGYGLLEIETRLQESGVPVLAPAQLRFAQERAAEIGLDALVAVLLHAKSGHPGAFCAGNVLTSRAFKPLLESYNADQQAAANHNGVRAAEDWYRD